MFCRKFKLKALLISLFFILSTLVSSCGYRFGYGGLSENYSTISVPYVEGDFDGSLTGAIISEIAKSGSFEYLRNGGALILQIKMIDLSDENIGFRYDRKKKGELTKSVIPTETRIKALIELIVLDAASGCVLLGPARLSAYIDFDHDYYSSRNGINIFSLGQLSDIDAAYDAVRKPLYYALARKIVEFVNDSW